MKLWSSLPESGLLICMRELIASVPIVVVGASSPGWHLAWHRGRTPDDREILSTFYMGQVPKTSGVGGECVVHERFWESNLFPGETPPGL